jgi:ketosteroid isomerase-like protein
MSANLDLVRSIYAAWERGDFGSTEWIHPDIEFVVAEGVNAGTCRGIAAMADAWRDYLSAFDDWRVEAEEYRELDDERVLVLARRRGRGKGSGVQVEQVGENGGTSLMHIRGGRVTRLVLYNDRKLAFADLGLAPEGGSA